jgi:hypothetical protein
MPALDFPTVVGLLSIAIAGWILYQITPRAARKRLARRFDLREPWVLEYWSMRRLLARAGLPRHPYETPYEYANRISEMGLPADVPRLIASMTAAFVAARYGAQRPRTDGAGVLGALRRALCQPETRKALFRMRQQGRHQTRKLPLASFRRQKQRATKTEGPLLARREGEERA